MQAVRRTLTVFLWALGLSTLACGQGSGDAKSNPTVLRADWEASASQPATGRLVDRPLSSKVLFVGMTDTQVLNLPSCGRPARITRSRETNTWREQWTYQDRNSGKERRILYFENGRLVTQEYIAPPPLREAQASASD